MKKKSKKIRRPDAHKAKKNSARPVAGGSQGRASGIRQGKASAADRRKSASKAGRVTRRAGYNDSPAYVYDIKGRPIDIETGEVASVRRGGARRTERAAFALEGESFRGIFRSSGKGFGFITPDGGGEDLFVPPPYVGGAMDGDTVEAKRLDERNGRGRGSEAAVLSVEKRSRESVTGTLCTDGRNVYIICDDRSACAEVTSFAVPAEVGDKVELRILRYPDSYRERTVVGRDTDGSIRRFILTLSGEVVADFGKAESREANYASILRENSIRTEFPPQAAAEAQLRSTEPVCPDGRDDLRSRIIFTIDGAGAKDLDDAISAERTDEGFLLGVHIADVSHYVTSGSALDSEALLRGTSVYFIDQVVPMLPREMSNGACSLNAGEDKYALSAFMRINSEGETVGYEFRKTVIRSAVRGVYTEVNDLLENGDASPFAEKYAAVRPSLEIMHELYLILADRAKKRGVLELDSPEAEFILGEDGLPEKVVPRVRGEGERMIEQFMLCANCAAASFAKENSLPFVYRIHQPPDPEKIRSFVLFAHNAGLDVSPLGSVGEGGAELSRTPGTPEMGKILAEAEEKGIGEVVSSVLLRSMMKAKYESTPSPHFGLGIPLYCHFTSPIRRYPDLFVHRAISAALGKKRPPSHERAQNAALLSSQREIAAQCAERQIEALYLTLWMKRHLGECFDGQVTGVCRSGIFVRTPMLCEGFVPEEYPGQIIDFNESAFTLRVRRSGGEVLFRLGDRVRVRAEQADVISRKITFSLI